MRITVFTSNQPRHIALVYKLASVADQVFAVLECKTNFPGKVADRIPKTPVMEEYFSHVLRAEEEVFGDLRFSPSNVTVLPIRAGDLSFINLDTLKPALASDHYVVFGSSYIKGDLVDFLVEHRAKNIHMGVSPYYRGNSCNFWALYDGRADLVGSTIHMLSKGLDSGGILFHALPKEAPSSPFVLGMMAVRAAQTGLVNYLSSGEMDDMVPVVQTKELEFRYTRSVDFTDKVAQEFMDTRTIHYDHEDKFENKDLSSYIRPYFT